MLPLYQAVKTAKNHRGLVRQRVGAVGDPEDLAHTSPYLTEHIKRFGEYCTHELGIEPEAYDPKLDVDFTLLREGDLNVVGLDRAA